jgi:hypothetical protein
VNIGRRPARSILKSVSLSELLTDTQCRLRDFPVSIKSVIAPSKTWTAVLKWPIALLYLRAAIVIPSYPETRAPGILIGMWIAFLDVETE